MFRVLDVFRPSERRGPVLVGETPAEQVTVGTRLVLSDNSAQAVEVVAVDMPTATSAAAGRLAVVVIPDLGEALAPGAEFEIVNPEA